MTKLDEIKYLEFLNLRIEELNADIEDFLAEGLEELAMEAQREMDEMEERKRFLEAVLEEKAKRRFLEATI